MLEEQKGVLRMSSQLIKKLKWERQEFDRTHCYIAECKLTHSNVFKVHTYRNGAPCKREACLPPHDRVSRRSFVNFRLLHGSDIHGIPFRASSRLEPLFYSRDRPSEGLAIKLWRTLGRTCEPVAEWMAAAARTKLITFEESWACLLDHWKRQAEQAIKFLETDEDAADLFFEMGQQMMEELKSL